MFCWPCIIVHHNSETNMTHFLFNLLRIKCLYMFRALRAHPHEVLHKQRLVYCVCVMSVGCTRTSILVQLTEITRKQYTKRHLFSASWGWESRGTVQECSTSAAVTIIRIGEFIGNTTWLSVSSNRNIFVCTSSCCTMQESNSSFVKSEYS
jgi:hypothetical protein